MIYISNCCLAWCCVSPQQRTCSVTRQTEEAREKEREYMYVHVHVHEWLCRCTYMYMPFMSDCNCRSHMYSCMYRAHMYILYLLLQAVLEDDPHYVVRRFESGKYAVNSSVRHVYQRALKLSEVWQYQSQIFLLFREECYRCTCIYVRVHYNWMNFST